MEKELPKKLQDIVGWSVELLGQAIKEEYGETFFKKVEKLRKSMKKMRGFSVNKWEKSSKILNQELKRIEKLNESEQQALAQSFSAMLELINRCESAYRTYRLESKKRAPFKKTSQEIIFVLTAHPTEARSPELLSLFENIQKQLLEALTFGKESIEKVLLYQLKILLKVPLARNDKPSVKDEAKNIYNFALKEEILSLLITFHQEGLRVRFRSWVGGDKDGHPGVNEKEMLGSLSLSRKYILGAILNRLLKVEYELSLLGKNKDILLLETKLHQLKKNLKEIEKVSALDGKKIVSFKKRLDSFEKSYEKSLRLTSPHFEEIMALKEVFPALVLPLEFREDSSVVKDALKKPKEFAIGKMLFALQSISRGLPARWYVRGFVLSMAESEQDIKNGILLLKKTMTRQRIPVIPLFETRKALINGTKILDRTFNLLKGLPLLHQEKWNGRFEVMLGYSDSSKESGVFPSRYLISKSMNEIDRYLKKKKLVPVFFHGSGGSVERGGGSIKEQISWWPKSAINVFKATLQGEMVARSFASKHILFGNIEKITLQSQATKTESKNKETDKFLKLFSEKIQKNYQDLIGDEKFLQIVEKASPYSYLDQLKIGSRPTKRKTSLKVGGLRAIPWILCWTQTRVLLPTWWGVGSAWTSMSKKEKSELRKIYKTTNFFKSYVKVLGFTLAKVDLSIWRVYLENSGLDKEIIDDHYQMLVKEFKSVLLFIKEITGQKNLNWYRPWLAQSIYLRSPMVHPLNLLQLVALKTKNEFLLRETVTGVACGMLTTG